MRTYRYNYTAHTIRAKNKGSVVGNPLGQFSVEARDQEEAIAIIHRRHNASDKRPVVGKSLLRDGLIHAVIKAGTHVRLVKPYRATDGGYIDYTTGVVVEVLDNNRFGVHLYRLGLTNAQDRYHNGNDNPTTTDFSAHELVGVPKPAKFVLPVRLVEHAGV